MRRARCVCNGGERETERETFVDEEGVHRVRPNENAVISLLLSASVVNNELSLIQMFPTCENILL